ncbi:hypothetical protein [Marinibacterium profundimaris]|uniref:Uncharacterized protein n=1 Tax=Marinibacterium profundimaris TaxID=1679460 RepID=A0A225NQK6_9RHOB|nr:hypothetical protein [Marinibacterium profundimaris]OWU77264.1 hypothetical protein ATO3_00550 [Marinibacterium profundimaris]
MSDTLVRLASQLADDVVAAMDEMGDERFFTEVAQVISASSQSLEEAFLTEVRIRLTEKQARAFLERRLAEYRAARPTPPRG